MPYIRVLCGARDRAKCARALARVRACLLAFTCISPLHVSYVAVARTESFMHGQWSVSTQWRTTEARTGATHQAFLV